MHIDVIANYNFIFMVNFQYSKVRYQKKFVFETILLVILIYFIFDLWFVFEILDKNTYASYWVNYIMQSGTNLNNYLKL